MRLPLYLDRRPGVSVLLFGFDADGLQRQLIDRVAGTGSDLDSCRRAAPHLDPRDDWQNLRLFAGTTL